MKFICEKCDKKFDTAIECSAHELLCSKSGNDHIYVAECFAVSQTLHEMPRAYMMVRETVPLSNYTINKFKNISCCRDYDTVNNILNDDKILEELPPNFINILCEDIGCDYQDVEKDDIIEISDSKTLDDYYPDFQGELIAEVKFRNHRRDKGEIGFAYISIFTMSVADFKIAPKYNIELDKWVTNS